MKKNYEHRCEDCPSRSGSIFCGVSPVRLEKLETHKAVSGFKRGQCLFSQGNPLLGVYCLESGKVKLVKHGPDGKDILVRIVGAGEVLGLRALITQDPYAVSAVAIEDGHVCFIDRESIAHMIESDPGVALEVMLRLAKQNQELEERVSDLSNKDVKKRLIQTLLMLGRAYGAERYDGLFINVRLTRSEIAAMISTSPETVMRMLSDLEKDQVVKLSGKEIILTDIPALKREIEDFI